MNFQSLKMGLVHATGLEKDALHIYAGMGIYLLGLFVFRRFRVNRGVLALLITTTIALLAEVLDLMYIGTAHGVGPKEIAASVHDIINTCLLPYTLFALSRWTTLFQTKR
ncbi:hypothetical protein [Psychrobacter pygoscelis]|uniref:hypothetical protein n=1 Tax=Psychrobacter pygoscelis TaxID=2488563 RepID=UPI00103CBB90|nr:hypothetical protein [Psychrobacter pygoscelis]